MGAHFVRHIDVLIPLLVRGPGITPNITNAADVYSMPDLGVTILDIAGATANYTLDGRPISFATPAFDNGTQTTTGVNSTAPVEEPRHTITEYWNIGIFEGTYASQSYFARWTDTGVTKMLPVPRFRLQNEYSRTRRIARYE